MAVFIFYHSLYGVIVVLWRCVTFSRMHVCMYVCMYDWVACSLCG